MMKCNATSVGVIGAAVAIVCLAITAPFVWLPDILTTPERERARLILENGDILILSEQWNGGDGYTLRVRSLNRESSRDSVIVDGDAFKVWHAKLTLSPTGVEVWTGQKNRGTYHPHAHTFSKN